LRKSVEIAATTMKENRVEDNNSITAKQAPTVVAINHAITFKACLHMAYKLSPRDILLHVENYSFYKGKLFIIYLITVHYPHISTYLV
jgi:hypothetical protein